MMARDFDDGPASADLDAIEAEWPVIEAELGVLDAEIAVATTTGGPAPLDWRRLRRAEAAWLRLIVARQPRTGMRGVAS